MIRLKLSQMTIQGHEASTPEKEALPNAFHHYLVYFRSLSLKDHHKHLVVITCTSSHSDATTPAPNGYLLGSLPCELLSAYPSPPAED